MTKEESLVNEKIKYTKNLRVLKLKRFLWLLVFSLILLFSIYITIDEYFLVGISLFALNAWTLFQSQKYKDQIKILVYCLRIIEIANGDKANKPIDKEISSILSKKN